MSHLTYFLPTLGPYVTIKAFPPRGPCLPTKASAKVGPLVQASPKHQRRWDPMCATEKTNLLPWGQMTFGLPLKNTFLQGVQDPLSMPHQSISEGGTPCCCGLPQTTLRTYGTQSTPLVFFYQRWIHTGPGFSSGPTSFLGLGVAKTNVQALPISGLGLRGRQAGLSILGIGGRIVMRANTPLWGWASCKETGSKFRQTTFVTYGTQSTPHVFFTNVGSLRDQGSPQGGVVTKPQKPG